MRPWALALLALTHLVGCTITVQPAEPRHRDPTASSTAAGAAIADAWQARIERKPNRWKRSRRACRYVSNELDAGLCASLAKKHRRERRREERYR
jgi:hypothetical protein